MSFSYFKKMLKKRFFCTLILCLSLLVYVDRYTSARPSRACITLIMGMERVKVVKVVRRRHHTNEGEEQVLRRSPIDLMSH